jgi:hypothetical protein
MLRFAYLPVSLSGFPPPSFWPPAAECPKSHRTSEASQTRISRTTRAFSTPVSRKSNP